MVHVPLMFLSEWVEFPSEPCLAGKKKNLTARVSMLLKSRESPDMFPFSLCNKKRLMLVGDTVNNTTRSFLIDVISRNQDIKKIETTCFGLTLAIFRFHLEKALL